MQQAGTRDRHTCGAPGAEPFGPGSLLWDLAGDHRIHLSLLMPTLMQAMHPVIGDALSRLPVTITDPWGRRARSVDSIHLWIYGGEDAIAEGRRLRELHRPVRGSDLTGREHPALDPQVWSWVALSAYPGLLTLCRVFGEPLSPADTVRLYAEVQNLARVLGVRERDLPPTVSDFWAYYDEMVSAGLVDHPHVHKVLAVCRRPPPPPSLPGPAAALWRALAPLAGLPATWLVHGTFPPEMREILHVSWSAGDERLFLLTGQVIRRLARITPERLRYAAMPLQARRLARAAAAGRPAEKHRRSLERHKAAIRARQSHSIGRPATVKLP